MNCVIKVSNVRATWWKEHMSSLIPEYNFYVETKGFFMSEDGTKHLTFREQHPNIDIRFVFSNSKNKLRKGAKTTYGEWCDRNGFLYSDRVIDENWLKKEK